MLPDVERGVGVLCPEGPWQEKEWFGTWTRRDQLQVDQGGEGYEVRKGADRRGGGQPLAGVIPAAWRQMRVVFIPKPGRDLTVAKNWRPLNLINCVGKLGEKVVADWIQDFGEDLFHRLQFELVRGRSAVDVLYRSVVKARACMDEGGSVGWGFWDVKGGFQNVVDEEVLGLLRGVEGTRGLCGWVEQFVAPRDFEVSWDGKVRG